MSNVDVLSKVATKAPTLMPKLGRVGLKFQKFSPEILFGVGAVAVVGGVVLACRSTLKIDEIIDDAKEDLSKIQDGLDELDNYSDDDAMKDKAVVYVNTAFNLAKLYLPAVTTIGLGIACFAGSHNIQHQRIAGLAAAYKTVEGGFKSYRNRIVDELGAEKEKELYFDSKKEKMEIIEIDAETGKEKKVKKEVNVVDIDNASEYARFFDSETSKQWTRNMDYNLDFLKMQQSYMNDRLHLMGHVFLNEVYDALGIDRSSAGAVVGWVDGGDGDNYIDFGMSDYFYNGRMGSDYVNGRNESILLDFNVDGSIWDKI